MKIPMSWINELVDIQGITPKEYAESLTMSGSKVEGIVNTGEEIDGVAVGRVLELTKHENADSLQVAKVDVGLSEPLQIVTGAKNIKVGDLVPIAQHGSSLPGGVKIKKGKLRGVESFGMMCSHQELALDINDVDGADENGILILNSYSCKPGDDIKKVLGLNENVVEFEITSNRPDCLSAIGLARETAVTFNKPLKLPKVKVKGSGGDINRLVNIEVTDGELCPRYAAKIVKNVKIEGSPKWLKDRLKACGIRPINNIVDITNYVLLEYGQPMHAFDLGLIEDNKIIVRRANEGEAITTLDGQKRELDGSMLVIADAKKPVAIAGIMGGEHSEIKENTKELLFESANFSGSGIRRTAKKLGMRTEASARYEKGLDPEMIMPALLRACELVELLGAGEVTDGVIDCYINKPQKRILPFKPDAINKFLGTSIDKEFMQKALADLGFEINGDTCSPPSYRMDIEGSADIAEEVARIYGYDKIPTTIMGGASAGLKTFNQQLEDATKSLLTGIGFYEVVTYSFTNPKFFEMLCLPHDSELRSVVTVTNPLGEEHSVMRTTMVHSVLEIIARNINMRNTSGKFFEIGRTYTPHEAEQLPIENQRLVMGMYGDVDYYSLKGAVEDLTAALNIKGISYKPVSDKSYFHPGRTAALYINDIYCGLLGEVHPSVLKQYDLSQKAYVAELDFDIIASSVNTELKYKAMPKYPSVSRDIAMLIDEQINVSEIEAVITKGAGKLLEELRLFDVYKGKQIAEGKKSVAYALTLRAADHTLNEEEISSVMAKIVKLLEKELGAVLR